VVRTAAATLPSYLRRHRVRQRAGNLLAAALADQCRAAVGLGHCLDGSVGVNLDDACDYLLYLPRAAGGVRHHPPGPVLAAAPPPGAVRIGRDGRARPGRGGAARAGVEPLVLRRAHRCPAVWAFLRASGYSFRFCGIGEPGVVG
jgi:hypothetical protein